MNYFAHAYAALQQPEVDGYYLAGVATPDWLNVTARRTKCRSRHAAPFGEADDENLSALARGVLQHHADDARFHELRAFTELSLDFSARLRNQLGDSTGLRPWFVGHVLVELLLDAVLIAEAPELLERYYEALRGIDSNRVEGHVQKLCGQSPGELAKFIGRFCEVRFLADYDHPERLRYRLNQVLSRVGLPELPAQFVDFVPEMREIVELRRPELMS